MIAEAGGFVSAPVFSSITGTVLKIDNVVDATGYAKPAIIITSDGEDNWEESIDRSETLETLEAHPELTPEEKEAASRRLVQELADSVCPKAY